MRFIILFLLWCPSVVYSQEETGKASFYADKFEGRPTASGEKYRHGKHTAAHRTLPFGTMVKVTNLNNNRSAVVRINDRGPFVAGRIIDLSKSAAKKLDFIRQGTTDVRIEVINAKETETIGGVPHIGKPPEAEPTKYYDLKLNTVERQGYGVQIGSYRNLGNLTEVAEKLSPTYKSNVTIKSKTIDNIGIYSLIIGQLDTRKDAEIMKKTLRKQYPDSFIVSFTGL